MAVFGEVVTAMVTPMRPDGSVDLETAARLARWLVEQGNQGLVVCGTTGEAPTLSDAEKLSMFEAVSAAVDVPVIAGTVGADTAHSVHLSQQAAKVGVAGILSLCPYYSRPSQAGIAAHLAAIAEATPLPNLIYDIPVRTGRKIATETIAGIAQRYPNVVGVKDAAGSPAETARLLALLSAARPDFEVYSGDDALTLPLLAIGAVGVVGVATHWSAPDHRAMFSAWRAGDTATAQRINQRLIESFGFETSESTPNPLPTKAMLAGLGFDVGHCRLPLGPIPDGLVETANDVYRRLVAARD